VNPDYLGADRIIIFVCVMGADVMWTGFFGLEHGPPLVSYIHGNELSVGRRGNLLGR
jgi:hypothetical protein